MPVLGIRMHLRETEPEFWLRLEPECCQMPLTGYSVKGSLAETRKKSEQAQYIAFSREELGEHKRNTLTSETDMDCKEK